ncbi:hypothetical protein [Bauldia sp.]|uniref:hypothetical protein n=1 Tax=Bauldia sp. TaxID=2575872 RepID=UPI003BAB8173
MADNAADVAAFQQSVASGDAPPAGTSKLLSALWHAAKGNMEHAFAAIEGETGKDAAWVRGHLHRRLGAHDDAASWYIKADQPLAKDPIDREWSQIAAYLLLRI